MKRGRPSKAMAVAGKAKTVVTAAQRAARGRRMQRMTASFLVLKEQLRRDAVETIREMGKILQEGATLLRGTYTEWIEGELGISSAAARNYRRIFELSESSPALFVDWKEIGASKMIRLARMPPGKRARAVQKKLRGKDVFAMTDAEFAVATESFVTRKRTVTNNMKAHGLRMKVNALNSFLREGLSLVPDKADVRRSLHRDLATLIATAQRLQKRLR